MKAKYGVRGTKYFSERDMFYKAKDLFECIEQVFFIEKEIYTIIYRKTKHF